MTSRPAPRCRRSGNPTLGLLSPKLEQAYQAPIWRAVAAVARERQANLLTFVGGILGGNPALPFDGQSNVLYTLPSPGTVDGLIVVTSSLGTFCEDEDIGAFCRRYTPLPVVSLGVPIEGIPSVITDNAQGLRDALLHLIKDHGFRRIAFIRGPVGNAEAELRYATYRETLASQDIPLDPDLVILGDFQPVSPAVHRYLERLREVPEAIAAANDAMAMTVLQTLPKYGLRVPEDIAVIGFDDCPDSCYASPPLTTVRQQIDALGRLGANLCLDLLEGKPVPLLTVLPTTPVVRRSCGCQMQSVANAAVATTLSASAAGTTSPSIPGYIPYQHLNLAFEQVLGTQDARPFFLALERSIESAPAHDLAAWQDTISAMRYAWVPRLLTDPARLVLAEDLWGQARILISSAVLSREEAGHSRQAYLAEAIRATGEALTTSFEIDSLMDGMASHLPILDIPACYIALYANDNNSVSFSEAPSAASQSLARDVKEVTAPEHARLAFAWQKETGRNKALEGTIYPIHTLLPAPALEAQPFNKIVHCLYFREHHLGLVVFDVGPVEAGLYDSLREQLSSAIRGSRLLRELSAAYEAVEQRVAHRTAELQREMTERHKVEQVRAALYRISEAAHSAQHPEDMYPVIHDIVSGLMPAGNFYIALYDSAAEVITFPYFVDEHDPPPLSKQAGGGLTELVLRTGAPLLVNPAAFDALVASGQVTPIGANSLDWLGVPLAVRGQVIGALVVQTYDPAIRYGEEDRDVLVFVSTQVATAIKRVEAEAERQQLLNALRERNTQLQTAAEVSKSALSHLDPGELVNAAVQVIQDRFGFYYVGLFLKDNADPQAPRAVLQAGTGDVGKRMVAEGHHLPIESNSMVGSCIKHVRARIAVDVGKESNRFANPSLPDTRSEVALPLISQGQGCLGALSVQSDEADAFNEADIAILQTMADHLAIAIENARLHDEIRRYAGDLEARVAERTAELVAMNRELASFSYSVSHDLRAPLRSIDGFSQALLEDYRDSLDATGCDYLQRIRGATQRMGQLIDDLLKLSRLSRGELHRAEANLSALAAQVLVDLQERAPHRCVSTRIAPDVSVSGDPRLLRVVMENLLGNAWKFSSRQQQAEIVFAVTTVDGERAYYVRDNGVGFDMAYVDKLFGAFQRLHSADEFEGTGIGLATVQRIIHRHGGRIWAHGEVGSGATFYFTLPQHASAGET